MMVEPPPAAPLVVSQPKVLLQILIVALDAPALIGDADQLVDGRVFGQRGQDVLARRGLVCRPLDKQPLLGTQACLARIAACMAHPYGREAASQGFVGALLHAGFAREQAQRGMGKLLGYQLPVLGLTGCTSL